MICPKCGGEFHVTSSRANADTVVRRRVCKRCKHIVYTKEVLTDSVFFCEVTNAYYCARRNKGDKDGMKKWLNQQHKEKEDD